LGAEIAQGRMALLSSELLGERVRVDDLRGRLGGAVAGPAEVEQAAAAIAVRRDRAQSELAGLSAEQERATRAFYAYESAGERVVAEAGGVGGSMGRAGRGPRARP